MRNLCVVVTVRERFGYTRECLQALLPQLPPSVQVVFAGGGIPRPVLSHLKASAKKRRGFSLILKDRFLFGNDARIMALGKARPKSDLIFLENDVVPQKGFLRPLLLCAREEKAGLVSPLLLEGVPGSGKYRIHVTGVRLVREDGPESPVRDIHYVQNHAPLGKGLRREAFDAVEGHCFFIRRDIFDQFPLVPGLDPAFAHLDLCFRAGRLGVRMFLEPSSRVVFANPKLAPLRYQEDFESFLTAWKARRWDAQAEQIVRQWGFPPNRGVLWGHQEWSMLNKRDFLLGFGVLNGWDLLLLRAARIRPCPTPIRRVLEGWVTSKVRRRAAWEPWPV